MKATTGDASRVFKITLIKCARELDRGGDDMRLPQIAKDEVPYVDVNSLSCGRDDDSETATPKVKKLKRRNKSNFPEEDEEAKVLDYKDDFSIDLDNVDILDNLTYPPKRQSLVPAHGSDARNDELEMSRVGLLALLNDDEGDLENEEGDERLRKRHVAVVGEEAGNDDYLPNQGIQPKKDVRILVVDDLAFNVIGI